MHIAFVLPTWLLPFGIGVVVGVIVGVVGCFWYIMDSFKGSWY